MIRVRRVPTVASSLIEVVEMVEKFTVDLVRDFGVLLQIQKFFNQDLVAIGKLANVFLQLLNLMLRCVELLSEQS
jgi:hypothetical protein